MSKSNRAKHKAKVVAKKQAGKAVEQDAGAVASASVVSPAVKAAVSLGKRRSANGQFDRASRKPRKETPDQVKRTVLKQRAKLVGKANAANREAESVLGVLKLNRLITPDEHHSGIWFVYTVHEGHRVDGYPPRTPRSADISSARGISTRDAVPTLADIQAKRRYEGALKILLKMGHHIYSEVDRVCIEDRPPTDLTALKSGLSALSKYLCT